MPTIEIKVTERFSRHLAAVRLMSYMVYPDDAELRGATELTFRTILADWYATALAKLGPRAQARLLRKVGPETGD